MKKFIILITLFFYSAAHSQAPSRDLTVYIGWGSATFWHDSCVLEGKISSNDALKPLLLETIGTQYHQYFFQGYYAADTSKKQLLPKYFDNNTKAWQSMQLPSKQDCRKLQDNMIQLVAKRTSEALKLRQ